MPRMVASRYAEISNTRRVGGHSEVFQAVDLHQGGREGGIKIVPAKSDEIYRIYFERETAALRRLSHPNVATLLASGINNEVGVYFVVLEWIPETIKQWVASLSEPAGWDDVAELIALPLASALAHSHSLSVLHRDIKPPRSLDDKGEAHVRGERLRSKLATGDARDEEVPRVLPLMTRCRLRQLEVTDPRLAATTDSSLPVTLHIRFPRIRWQTSPCSSRDRLPDVDPWMQMPSCNA